VVLRAICEKLMLLPSTAGALTATKLVLTVTGGSECVSEEPQAERVTTASTESI